ncbi:ATP-binding protein [Patescibacteria group bacterium]|nr:ATP-binding protein [Patescibacteria group bacterium]
MKEKIFEFETKGELKNLSIIGDFIAETMRQLGVDHARDIFDIQLAVDEACTNIVKYAYSCKDGGMIVIRCCLANSGNNLVVTIKDRGKPFDPSKIPPPDTKAALSERKVGGLGMFLMRELMDEIRYAFNKEENDLTLVKYLGKPDHKEEEDEGRG